MSVFISYTHKSETDIAYVSELAHYLTVNAIDCWYDDYLKWGDDWFDVLTKNLQKASLLIVVTSEKTLESNFVAFEVLYAKANGKNILSITLDGTILEWVGNRQSYDLTKHHRDRLPPLEIIIENQDTVSYQESDQTFVLSKDHYDADYKLFEKFYNKIDVSFIYNLSNVVHSRILTREEANKIGFYLDERRLPTHEFINFELENCVKHFDRFLENFYDNFYLSHTFNDHWNVFKPNYKFDISETQFQNELDKYHHVVGLADELQTHYAPVIRTVKHIYTKFDFDK